MGPESVTDEFDPRLVAYVQAEDLIARVDRMRADDPEYMRITGSDRYQGALETVAKMNLESRVRPTDPEAPTRAERAAAKKERAARPTREPKECLCGCGGMTKGGRFIPGHDARYHAAQKRAGAAHV